MSGLASKMSMSLKNEGLGGFCKRTVKYILKKAFKVKIVRYNADDEAREAKEKEEGTHCGLPFADVLFIDGCGEVVPHPSRYRVTHQREQLEVNGISTDQVFYAELKPYQVKFANVFIFFRCPVTKEIEEFISTAKRLNKTVIFDVDDLVIDTKYTDTIKYVQAFNKVEKEMYDDGVNRMGRTLSMCQAAITTTERLAIELSSYVPEVFINRNTASERMYELSEIAYEEKLEKDNQTLDSKLIEKNDKAFDANAIENASAKDEIRIGYFSGSLTHNDDFIYICPVLTQLMDKYQNLRLCVVGELDLPEAISAYSDRVIRLPFGDWQELPGHIASCDINIAPIEDTIFNEAKSENKWVEAALVRVPTVASNVGAFKQMIEHRKTGLLCDSLEDWERNLTELIESKDRRNELATNAYKYAKTNCLTMYTGVAIRDYVLHKEKTTAVVFLPSTEISGGIMVALKHAAIMQKNGVNVTILAMNPSKQWMEYDGCLFPVVTYQENELKARFDIAIATMWNTAEFIEAYPRFAKRFYLVQNFETDFYEPNVWLRPMANRSYSLMPQVNYVTISKWCQRWLKDTYHKDAKYVRNGIDLSYFALKKRDFNSGKIRILIEGDCAVAYKGVDDSFRIANALDKDRFEIWYMSYNEAPKDWYRVDKFLHRIPYEEVGSVYGECHILLKSSTLESFSYPPLEMMATGGFVVAVQNDGNSEYLVNDANCLIYEYGDTEAGIAAINKIVNDDELRTRLLEGSGNTVAEREWRAIEDDVLKMYGV